ncbi:MAG: hypothetical protein GWN86_24805 [Desulfobacterales bacterium]|nr:hypothetical protein [Desulfobacterales bacterium]
MLVLLSEMLHFPDGYDKKNRTYGCYGTYPPEPRMPLNQVDTYAASKESGKPTHEEADDGS